MSASVTSANWIDVNSVPSGSWTDATHWSTASVPGVATSAVIGPSVSASAPWTVSLAGSQAVAALTLQMGTLGTLSIAGALNVSGNASMGYGSTGGGTVLLGSGATLGINGNSVTQQSTFEVNGGTITTGGFFDLDGDAATVSNAGVWNADTLWIGQFFTTGMSVQGAGAAINASTVINIGADGTASAPFSIGAGTLAVTGGAAVSAPTMKIVDGSVLTIDATSSVDLQAAGVAGAVAIGAAGTLLLESAKVEANVVDNGAIVALVNTAGSSYAIGHGPVITGALSGAGSVHVGGGYTMEVGSAAGFTGNVTIDPQSTLVIDTGAGPAGAVSMNNSAIDLRALTYGTGAGPALSYSGSTLTVGADSIVVGAGLAVGDFTVAADSKGGTIITDIACYAAGTRIAAAFGEIAVEMLRAGDLVRTAGDRLAPVAWVGHTTLNLDHHPAPRQAAPVRIAAGAFAPGLPRRDLLVSPDHAMLVDDVLIPAHRLINGASIRQDTTLRTVRYIHVELDRHDLLLAEGLASESYLDTGNRGQFDGESGRRMLHPRFDTDPTAAALRAFAERGCAPLVLDGALAHAAHARLAARAEALGWRRSADPALCFTADRPGLEVAIVLPDLVRLALPPGTRQVRIASRRFVPDTQTPGCGDGRLLGAALAVALDGARLDGAALAAGWYPAEDGASWRWTNGDAVLTLPDSPGGRVLAVHVVPMGTPYWDAPNCDAPTQAASRAA